MGKATSHYFTQWWASLLTYICVTLPEISMHWYPFEWLVHDDVIKWKHFPRYWPFVQGIHRASANSPHKGQWQGALMFSFICALNKQLSKQSWGWWFETPSHSLWRHCNVHKIKRHAMHSEPSNNPHSCVSSRLLQRIAAISRDMGTKVAFFYIEGWRQIEIQDLLSKVVGFGAGLKAVVF